MEHVADGAGPVVWSKAWRSALAVLLITLLIIGLIYRQTLTTMIDIWWRSETFNHCFLIAPISAWLIWGKRHDLARVTPAPSPWMLVVAILAGLAWMAGELASVNSITQLAVVTLMLAAVPAIVGTRAARTIAFPLGFLYFAVPIGEFVMPKMMEWTADFTVFAVALSGVPVFREGQHFVIPSGSWSVVEACSGVRYLIASTTVGTLFAYLNYRSMLRRWVFVGFAILMPIVANWLRAYMIVMLGHLSNNRIAVGVDHLLYGWVFFGIVIVIMFMVGARWSEPPPARLDLQEHVEGTERIGWPSWPAGLGVLALAFLPMALNAAIVRSEAAKVATVSIPLDVDGWVKSADLPLTWRPSFSGAVAADMAYFRNDDISAGMYVAYYRNQSADRKLVSSENVIVKTMDNDWSQVKSGTQDAEFAGHAVRVATAELRSNRTAAYSSDARWRVHWFYWIDGHLTFDPYRAKALTAWARVRGHGDDGAVVIFFAPESQRVGGEAAIAALAKASGPRIAAALRAAAER